ncbi:ATP-binding SpoIIE family protein phosphatase [Luteimicrobium subarcticum]|uniref:PAS domain-containing protein n=1 Tax=Luteimicrobium subarcticum TaxID=620910 RepID=A0A2M8WS75_9MICO|nr:ATP-binding SpoIIE family protein phosphatase [Luteimicrobium subarcticum]PJI93768.1 PAS domain-containing protein [Luteimicrobium subarcticum]
MEPSPRRGLPDAALRTALETSAVPMYLMATPEHGLTVEWVNDAFVAHAGVARVDLLGRRVSVLRGLIDDLPDLEALRTALRGDRSFAVTVRDAPTAGAAGWVQLSFSPIRGDDGAMTHWFCVLNALPERPEETESLSSLEMSRRRMARLDLMTQVSGLLTDLDHPHVLREIADVLGRAAGCRIFFYMDDKGLAYTESVDVNTPPSSRLVRGPQTRPVPLVAGTEQTWAPDVVQAVLDGEDAGPVDVSLDARYPPRSASAVLVRDLRARLETDGVTARGIVVHPVPGRRRVLGLLVVVLEPGREFTPSLTPGTTLRAVSRRAGMLIDTARLYAREHRVAETLQRAMLPEQADVHGLDVWTYYAPNSDHAQVGGDWYDVLQLTEHDVGLVVGDVVGHDVEAAATMGQMRSVVRSYAFEMTAPGAVLERVDELVAGMRLPRASSLVYARLEARDEPVAEPVAARHAAPEGVEAPPATSTRTWRLSYSRAGHLPPVLVRGDRSVLLDGAGGSLIGYGSTPRATDELELQSGDVLVFYTDGLIERRDRDLREGLAVLGEELAGMGPSDAAGIGEQLLARVGSTPEDDIAVVVVRVPGVGDDERLQDGGPRSRRWLLPNEPSSIARARHVVVRTCTAWGVPGAAAVELVASELVANAVMHGWGHVALRLFDTADGLRIEVEDANPSPPVATDGHINRGGGFGMQIVERLADWGWRPTRVGKVVWAKVHPAGAGRLTPAGGTPRAQV